MSAADKLTQVTRHANTVDDLAAEGRNYGDDYMAALETSAADVPALVNALQAVLNLGSDWESHAARVEDVYGRQVVSVEFAVTRIRKAIEEALS